MSPVPVDPFPDFLAGAVANPDQVDARFLELYKALDPAQRGIDDSNIAAAAAIKESKLASGANGPLRGYFSVYRAAAGSLSSGDVVVFDTEDDDMSGWYDPATGRFQPTVPCVCDFSWAMSLAGALTADNYLQVSLWKNGALEKFGSLVTQRGSVPLTSVGSGPAKFNGATDFVQVRVGMNEPGARAIATGRAATFFAGHLIGRT